MKIANLFAAALLLAGTAMAQQMPPDRPFGPWMPRPEALKNYLSLSDQQMSDLEAARRAFFDAARPLLRQIAEKRQALQAALGKDPIDTAQVQQVRTDIKTLTGQLENSRSEYAKQARGTLTAAQITALGTLEQALAMQAAAREAAALNLIQSPEGHFGPLGAMQPRGGGPRRIPRP